MHKLIIGSTIAFSLAAVGCSKLTIVGVSGPDADASTPLTTPAPRAAIVIGGVKGELLQPYSPALGDLDGDGYDDFVLGGSSVDGLATGMTAYLFYGRPAFAERLVSTDADATFASGVAPATPLGDINGDGLADFALVHRDGFELIFGSKTRWTGHHAKFSTGQVVTYPARAGSAGIDLAALESVHSLGDLNGDGKTELAVRLTAPVAEGGNGYGVGMTDYILEGRDDGWPTGEWDPSWAIASLGHAMAPEPAPASEKLRLWSGGDLDGDGYTDLLALGDSSSTTRLFYGKPEGLHGRLTPAQADAELDFGPTNLPGVVGDLDDDGRDDLAVLETNALKIVYGSQTRFAGRVQPQPALTFVDKGPYNSVGVGDINGDGRPDLVFQGNHVSNHIEDWSTAPELSMRLYLVRGTGTRLTGERRDTDSVFQPVGYTAPEVLNGGGFNISFGGDLDGDGSADLVLGAPGQQDPADSMVYVLPGSMNDPD